MADKKLWDYVPEQIKEEMLSEAAEILKERAQAQQQQAPKVDPAIKAIAERRIAKANIKK